MKRPAERSGGAAGLFVLIGILAILGSWGLGGNQWRHTLALLLPGAAAEGAAAIWVYRWLEKFDWLTFKNARAQQMMDDELALEGEGL